jgi:hypothetical protein
MLIECAPLTICFSLIPSPNGAILFTNLIWMPFIYLNFFPINETQLDDQILQRYETLQVVPI